MVSSDTEIANIALRHLGHSSDIANLETENSVPARAMRKIYYVVRDQMIRSYDWNFARKYAALIFVASSPSEVAGMWGFSHQVPADCLNFRKILSGANPEQVGSPIPFERVGSLIYSHVSEPRARYST